MRLSARMALLVFTIGVSLTSVAYGQCLMLALPHDPPSGRINPDSIMVDTCFGTRTPGAGILPWTRYYAKHYFDVQLDRGFLSASAAADDEGFFDIDDFDTAHADYSTWKQLSDDNGGLAIRRTFAQQTDTTILSFFAWQLKFNDYARIDTVESVLKMMSSCRYASFAWQMAVLHGIASDPGMKPKSSAADIAKPGARFTGSSDRQAQQELGWQASHYEIDIPMAWEITKGNDNVVVAVADNMALGRESSLDHQVHQDMKLVANGGNYLFHESLGAGTVKLRPLMMANNGLSLSGNDEHGYHIALQIAAEANDVGLVGVAPRIQVAAVGQSVNCGLMDCRPDVPNVQVPHVMNCSYGGSTSHAQSMEAGVVVVSSMANFQQYNSSFRFIEKYMDGKVERRRVYQNISWNEKPGNEVVISQDGPRSRDYEVLTLHGYRVSARSVSRMSCDGGGQDLTSGVLLEDQSNFSPGVSKFPPVSSDYNTAEDIREAAALDLIVPYCQGMLYHYDVAGRKPLYSDGWIGNSYAIPLASGVVGLMMSVHDRLGQTGADVQRRVYDIVTFTADKIEDPGFVMTINQALEKSKLTQPVQALDCSDTLMAQVVPIPNKHMFDTYYCDNHDPQWDKHKGLFEKQGSDLRANLKLRDPKGNDPLGRWWGNRVGFGRLNAFRSVAHAIPEVVNGVSNVQYEYANGSALSWANAHPMQGRSFLHLGKFKEAGKRVLDVGGILPPGEPPYRNNNGQTLVNTTQLTVSSSQTLVIDGILTTTTPDKNPKISTSGDGKILATGWVDNVTLNGFVNATDLRVRRSETGSAIIFKSSSKPSVLYDTLWADGKGDVVIEEGALEMQPASVIIVRGQARIVVKPGAKLVMEHGANIIDERADKTTACIQLMASSGGKQGGKLEIADNMELVVIDASVGIQDGAELSVGKAAKADGFPVANLFLRGVEVEKGGKLSINPEAIVRRSSDPSVPSSIVVKSSAVLEFPKAITTKIDVPFDVLSGATLRIPPTAVATIGALNVRSGGSVIVQGGGTLQFLDEKNTVRGRLIAEGIAQNKAVVKAAQEVAIRCEGIYKVPIVRLELSPDAWPVDATIPAGQTLDVSLRSYFHAQNAEFENVFTTLRNMPVLSRQDGTLTLGTLTNVTFKANRKVFVDQTEEFKSSSKKLETRFRGGNRGEGNTLLTAEYSRTDFRELYKREYGQTPNYGAFNVFSNSVKTLTVDTCVFGDAAGSIAKPPSKTTYRDLKISRLESDGGDYPVIGLKSTMPLKVFRSDFAYLLTGILAEGRSGQNRFEGNKFTAHSTALSLKNISSTVCSNKITACVNGVAAEGGTLGLINNTFGGRMTPSDNRALINDLHPEYIGSGCLASAQTKVRVLGNSLKNYGTGLHAESGRFEAGDAGSVLLAAVGQPQVVEQGRNIFNRAEYDSKRNLYQLGQGTDAQQSDIFFDLGTANIVCGKTNFNMVADQKQLQKLKGTAPITVRVSSNNFGVDNANDIRRNELVFVEGTDLRNGQNHENQVCVFTARDRQEMDCAPWARDINGTGGLMAMLMAPQGAGQVQLPLLALPDDADLGPAFAATLFQLAHMVVASPNASPETRVDYLDYAIRAVREHPNADSATDALVATLVDVSQNQATAGTLRARAVLESAGLLAQSEHFAEAHQLLQISDSGLFTDFDSLSFVLVKDELAVRADSSLTVQQKSDILASIDVRRIEHLKRAETAFYKESIPPQPASATGSLSGLGVTVYPNPSRDHFIVRVDALPSSSIPQWLDVRVRSLTGEEVLRRQIADVHVGQQVRLDNTGLESGIYIVEALTEGSHSTTIITVVQ